MLIKGFVHIFTQVHGISHSSLCNRQMRGEDIQGLNIEELLKLEKMLEAGLSRVLKSKVLHPFTFCHA